MIDDIYENGVVVERWDSNSREWTDFRTNPATVLTYAQKSIADGYVASFYDDAADARQLVVQDEANQQTIEQALFGALATLQAIIDDTNANINSSPAPRIKDLARVLRRVIRLVIRRFDGVA